MVSLKKFRENKQVDFNIKLGSGVETCGFIKAARDVEAIFLLTKM